MPMSGARHSETPKMTTKVKGRLTAKQLLALEGLLRGDSITHAATGAGVTRQALHNWLKEASFKAELDAAQRQSVQAAVRKLTAMLDRSVAEVERLVAGGEDEAVRLRAALAVPSMLRDLREHIDLAEQVAMLEAALRESDK